MSKLENELLSLNSEQSSQVELPKEAILESDVYGKEQYLRTKRVNRNYNYEKRIESEIEKTRNLDIRTIPEGYYEDLEAKAQEIRLAQTNSHPFITPKLTELVSLSFPNLITVGALSGSGKTTAAANITFQLYQNGRRVLIISNEELTLDVLDRISCMEKGYDINQRATFSEEQNRELDLLRPVVGDFVRVVDTAWAGNPELTTSIEGIQSIFQSLIKQEKFFDCIILDYYQKVTVSKEDPDQAGYSILQELSNTLDHYYKLVKAPIVVLTQLHPVGEGQKEFEKRIKGGKSIMMPSTFVLELKKVDGEYASDWICHKHRWGNEGKKVRTAWNRGKFEDQ